MKQRLISAFVGIIVLVLVLLGNQYVFDFVVTIIASVAVYEVLNALNLKKFTGALIAALSSPVLLSIASCFPHNGKELFIPVIFVVSGIIMLYMLFNHEKFKFNDAASFIAVSFIVPICFLCVMLTRRLGMGNIDVFIILIGCWVTDSCAYFAGMFFGKHKLAPVISPKKTVEGSIGGIFGVALILVAYAFVTANIMDLRVNVFSVIVIGVISGTLSQCGDLCASIIKRENNIKDFGNLMPGHGGVMDRFDSFLFVAPIVYYILSYFPVFY